MVAHAEGVFQIDQRIEGFDIRWQSCLDSPMPIDEGVDGEIIAIQWTGTLFEFEVEDGFIYVDTAGRRISVDTEPVTVNTVPNPEAPQEVPAHCPSAADIVFDGFMQRGTSYWFWSFDGMLLRLPNG